MIVTDTLLFFAAHDPELLPFWRNATIGIAGAGGLGSNIAISLCRAGIGKLIIADFDTVSLTNLNRQQFYLDQVDLLKVDALRANLLRISPYTEIRTIPRRVSADNLAQIFGSVDILIEAFDAAEQKQMLIESWQVLYPHKPIIAASGIAGVGDNDSLKTIRLGNLYLCGDGSSELLPGISPVAPRVAIVANMQANLCLELLLPRPGEKD
ncbi:MAG: thiamine biosynthesis protein ThiF [Candidatus Cloacimonetes bacterium HGW-Cloacimonetes-1]|jgi:sulfur carrier protein ThiS adenylyltransferase|nr:MAG: thiamine biosynthesis protein ThiF [Candidatus Cloacimonetes bacterium HGW-Cloacimonetes-1]